MVPTGARHLGKRHEVAAKFTDVAAAMADAPGPEFSPDILEAYLRDELRLRLQPPGPTYRGLSPGTSSVYTPYDFVPGASPPADLPSESAVKPALCASRQWLPAPCSGSHDPFNSAYATCLTNTISMKWHIVSTSPA